MNRILSAALMALAAIASLGAEPRRLVIVKVDGLPVDLVDRYVRERDPVTGKSRLPWIDLVFRRQGTWVKNFYVRGISLSVPSWSLLDTGQHLVIHGNAEYDRYTLRVFDYMNFFPFYVDYARSKEVDMPAVQTLDEAGVPLLIDRYAVDERYQGLQLYQRGVYWKTLQGSLVHRFTSRSPGQLFNEWQAGGLDLGGGIDEQIERELESKLADPEVHYLDIFFGDYDHIAHLTNDPATQYDAMKKIDGAVGRIWTAIQSTLEAPNTVLALVSDHGMNTDPAILSQGYSLIDFFNSAEGGGHHVVTNRHPLTEFKLKGLDPFVSEVTSPSSHSFYLRDQADQYPTAVMDLDGNERASVHLRNNRLNELHILLQQLARRDLSQDERAADVEMFYARIQEQRPVWDRELTELNDELAALKRSIDSQEAKIKSEPPRRWTEEERQAGLDRNSRRKAALLRSAQEDFAEYTEYAKTLNRLLSVEPSRLDPSKLHIEDLIPKRSLGDGNSIYDLQNYTVAWAPGVGFKRLDYFPLLTSLRVRNVVQKGVGSKPIDFIAVRVSGARSLPDDAESAIWVYESEDSQALILSREGPSGLELKYLPIRALQQDRRGETHYETQPWRAGLPLRYFESPELNVTGDRAEWLSAWHTDREWLDATHRTLYSNGIIGLQEELQHKLPPPEVAPVTDDEKLLRRFEVRRRDNVQADMLILASDHWNFNVRGFNPGGNHGSFFRISTHATLLLNGAGVPKGLEIERPYDSLSFAPTVLSLAGTLQPGELRRLAGLPIEELVAAESSSAAGK